jgi:SET domain-containing protein
MKKFSNPKYNDIISLENLLLAWQEFLSDKKKKIDLQEFQKKSYGQFDFSA